MSFYLLEAGALNKSGGNWSWTCRKRKGSDSAYIGKMTRAESLVELRRREWKALISASSLSRAMLTMELVYLALYFPSYVVFYPTDDLCLCHIHLFIGMKRNLKGLITEWPIPVPFDMTWPNEMSKVETKMTIQISILFLPIKSEIFTHLLLHFIL